MNDEFYIDKMISRGSSGSYEENYILTLENHPIQIDGMKLAEIDRLQKFLAEYIKFERNQNEKTAE